MTKELNELRLTIQEFQFGDTGFLSQTEGSTSDFSPAIVRKEMKTKQALVTVGGKSSRLKKSGVNISYSKSFLMVEGKPLFYWCLLGLYEAGIEKLVIIADQEKVQDLAGKVIQDFPFRFQEVVFHRDPGLGSNGLPYQAKELLDEYFFFECGHSMSSSLHYCRMDKLRKDHNIILSAFKPNRLVCRPYANINSGKIEPIEKLIGRDNEYEIGSPFLLNRHYVNRLPEIDFSVREAINLYNNAGKLALINSVLPIEFDVVEEMENAIPQYIDFINQSYKNENKPCI